MLQARRLAMRASRILRAKFGPRQKTYSRHRVDEYRDIWSAAAAECGATLVEIDRDIWRLERDGVVVHARNDTIQLDDPVTLAMAGRKALIHRLAAEAGLSVPEHHLFTLDELASAESFLAGHPEGVVVKPANNTAASDGVTTHVRSAKELRRAAILASLYGKELLVEKMVPGESYRVLVLAGRMIHAVCRRGPRVLGDGQSMVRTLIASLSASRQKDGLPEIQVDADCRFTLGWQGLSPEAIPDEGQEVLVRAVETVDGGEGEIRTVYNTVVTDDIHREIQGEAEKAAALLGADFVGVDIITTDGTRPLADTGGCINEVNTTPALHHHYDPTDEGFPRVAVDVLQLALKRRSERGGRVA